MASNNVAKLLSDTIDRLKSSSKRYDDVKDDNNLREAFHEAGRGLLLVEKALETTNTILNGGGLAEEYMDALKDCNEKSKWIKNIFVEVCEGSETSRVERYKTAVKEYGKGSTVEALVKGMMTDVCDMSEDNTIKAEMEPHVEELNEAIDKLSKMEPSIPSELPSGVNISNYGSGSQYNSTGPAPQYNNTGNGGQFLRPVYGGAYFGVPPPVPAASATPAAPLKAV